jgi:hypothetical protein
MTPLQPPPEPPDNRHNNRPCRGGEQGDTSLPPHLVLLLADFVDLLEALALHNLEDDIQGRLQQGVAAAATRHLHSSGAYRTQSVRSACPTPAQADRGEARTTTACATGDRSMCWSCL